MIREVNLLSYLPPFMAEYQEVAVTLRAEDPEFRLLWEAVDRLYKNEFILDADEYGISRFERLLKLHPYDTDTLEVRRLRVLAKWFKRTPYTFPWLKEWMIMLCGALGHAESFVDYLLFIQLDQNVLPLANDIAGIIFEILPPIIPANMCMELRRKWEADTSLRVGACAESRQRVEVWPRRLTVRLDGTAELGVNAPSATRQNVEVWPRLARTLNATAGSGTDGGLVVRQSVEVFPKKE